MEKRIHAKLPGRFLMAKPLLTIGIPTFNRCAFLTKAVESCIHQKNVKKNQIEIIVANNCSTDGTEKYLKKMAGIISAHQQFSVIHHRQQIPPMENWQSLVDASSGTFFLLLSDDDVLDEAGIEAFLYALKQTRQQSVNGILGSFCKIDARGRSYSYYHQTDAVVPVDIFYEKLVKRQIRYVWCAFISRTTLLKEKKVFKQEFLSSGMCADGAAILTCCSSSGKIITMSKMLGKYRIHPGNNSAPVDTITTAVASRECFIRFAKSIKISEATLFWTIYWCIDGLVYQLARLLIGKSVDKISVKKLRSFFLKHQHSLASADFQKAKKAKLLLQFKYTFFIIVLSALLKLKLIR